MSARRFTRDFMIIPCYDRTTCRDRINVPGTFDVGENCSQEFGLFKTKTSLADLSTVGREPDRKNEAIILKLNYMKEVIRT